MFLSTIVIDDNFDEDEEEKCVESYDDDDGNPHRTPHSRLFGTTACCIHWFVATPAHIIAIIWRLAIIHRRALDSVIWPNRRW
jgi:hypothetical protein